MKVLIAIPCLLTGGTEIQTLNLVRALIQGGHQVTTACYFEHTENMVKLYEDAGSKVVLFSKEGVRLGGRYLNVNVFPYSFSESYSQI